MPVVMEPTEALVFTPLCWNATGLRKASIRRMGTVTPVPGSIRSTVSVSWEWPKR